MKIIDYARDFFEDMRIDVYRRGQPYSVCHLKRDGWCLYVFKDGGNQLHMYTRKPRRVSCEQPWVEELQKKLSPGDLVVGEIFVPGGSSQDVASVFSKASTKMGKFEVFYAPKLHSFNEFEEWNKERELPYIQFAELSERIPQGYEGYVLKRSYHPNCRGGWMKHKPTQTYDLRITRMDMAVEGRHRFAARIKSFTAVSDNGRLSTKVGIMSDKVRGDMTTSPEKYIGQVVEVRCQFVTDAGSLRHPRYIRMRLDKDSTDD